MRPPLNVFLIRIMIPHTKSKFTEFEFESEEKEKWKKFFVLRWHRRGATSGSLITQKGPAVTPSLDRVWVFARTVKLKF
jgi:hypothetical protein